MSLKSANNYIILVLKTQKKIVPNAYLIPRKVQI